MKLLKIVFLIISTNLFLACDGENSGSSPKIRESYDWSESYELNTVNFSYNVNRADFLTIESSGILNYSNVERVLQKSKKVKKCRFYQDLERAHSAEMTPTQLLKFFNFYVDGRTYIPYLTADKNLRLELPAKSIKVELKLKKEFQGIANLMITKSSKDKYCFEYSHSGRERVQVDIMEYGKYKRINLLKKLQINLRVAKGFLN